MVLRMFFGYLVGFLWGVGGFVVCMEGLRG